MHEERFVLKSQKEALLQQQYYTQTAESYDEMHVHSDDEHFFALGLLIASIDHFGFESVLDVGAGTGRALSYIKERKPGIRAIGVEPVRALREVGYRRGILRGNLIEGNALDLEFNDGDFDVVCEFGVLHHTKEPSRAISEMLRVAKKAIFVSDSNNFGQGSLLGRALKQLLNALRLWSVADFIKTGGRGYTISEGDGLAYSYSVFNNYSQIRNQCKSVHILNTQDGYINPYRTAGHVALLGIKK